MKNLFTIFELISHIFLVLTLGWYLITNLQWYNYKLERMIFKHKRVSWHILYFILPIFTYYISGKYFWIYFYLGLLPALYVWNKKLDKKLVFTARVKRFLIFLIFFTIFADILTLISTKIEIYPTISPLLAALFFSYIYEKIVFNNFKKEAKRKLTSIENLQIVAITASYGKTSIKNFLYQLTKKHIKSYKTPRSVNTLTGIIKDINEDLPKDTKLYIVEAGAREKGDIDKISRFINPQYVIVGNIGPQHIEYFKTLENIRNTKMEIINSNRLKKAFIHKSANVKPEKNIKIFNDEIQNIKADLNGLEFDLKLDDKIYHFQTQLLGKFNAINITAAILIARELGINIKEIQHEVKNLKPVEHRLQKINSSGKLIIDDSFNGNIEGMISSYELVKNYTGRKVIITPGVIESDEKTNIKLAKKIDEVFDIVIITGKVNAYTLNKEIKRAKKVILKDKSKLEDTLIQYTKAGDLILFSNDAPTFI